MVKNNYDNILVYLIIDRIFIQVEPSKENFVLNHEIIVLLRNELNVSYVLLLSTMILIKY